MDELKNSQAYETPRVVDFGDLQELTADCAGVTGGDSAYPSGVYGGGTVGMSNPAAHCSTP